MLMLKSTKHKSSISLVQITPYPVTWITYLFCIKERINVLIRRQIKND